MDYREYFKKFNLNDNEQVKHYVPNDKAEDFLIENAPRLYCPDEEIEETFAFRTWTMRKHINKTEAGFVLTEFLPDVYWAGKYNTINCPLIHHLNEFRWLKNSDDFLDYITFFLNDDSAYSYHVPALYEMIDFCVVTGNEWFVEKNINKFERYFDKWVETHFTKNGLFWSIDDREGTEYSISGTFSDMRFDKGLRVIINSCMYGDAIALSKYSKKSKYYLDFASKLKKQMDEKMWDGELYKSIHPLDGDVNKELSFKDIVPECNARELMSYAPWMYNMPSENKSFVFNYLLDEKVFKAKTGLTSADRSNPRYMYPIKNPNKACTWSGLVWPFAISIALNSVINLLNNYSQAYISDKDLFDFTKTYAHMHYSIENGKRINFIDEAMKPDEYIWHCREFLKNRDVPIRNGGKERGRDYNHSTFIDIVLRGICGIDLSNDCLVVKPRVEGIWKWFKIENLTYKKKTYNIYYDIDGNKFNKGKGVVIERE